ncbi:MAG: type II toxin-antitoxin system VapC family toxin [Caldilineaceae bacterium]
MIVVDVNVVAYLLIAGDKTPLAQQAWAKDPHWRVPTLWRHELLNVLATYVRTGGATTEDAVTIWQQATALLGGEEEQPSMEQALLLSAEYQISAFDAQYVALALAHKLPLITEDRALQRKFPETVLSLEEFCRVNPEW